MLHNAHMDQVRAINAGMAFPTPIDPHDLQCALMLAENARLQLVEAFRLSKPDTVLSIRAEEAGKACKRLAESVRARLEQKQ